MHFRSLLGLAVGVCAASTGAQGAVVITSSNYLDSGGGGNYTNASAIGVSNTDLIQGLAPSATNYAGCCETSGGTTAPLTNGSAGPGDTTSTANAAFDINALWFATYTLPVGNGNGYDISSISVATGHQDARVNQDYQLEVSQNGTTFTSLGTFTYHPSGGNGGSAISTVTDNAAGSPALGTGIKAVRFTILDNGNGVYREFDVQGTQSVPEPASLSVIALAGAALLARRRHD